MVVATAATGGQLRICLRAACPSNWSLATRLSGYPTRVASWWRPAEPCWPAAPAVARFRVPKLIRS